jgi:hypothetical protein
VPPTTSLDIDALVCQSVNAELLSHTFAELNAMSAEDGTERAAVAKKYVNLAGELRRIANSTPLGSLYETLTEWLTASLDVAAYVADREPEPGIVIDYGPPFEQWKAAQQTRRVALRTRATRCLPDVTGSLMRV